MLGYDNQEEKAVLTTENEKDMLYELSAIVAGARDTFYENGHTESEVNNIMFCCFKNGCKAGEIRG